MFTDIHKWPIQEYTRPYIAHGEWIIQEYIPSIFTFRSTKKCTVDPKYQAANPTCDMDAELHNAYDVKLYWRHLCRFQRLPYTFIFGFCRAQGTRHPGAYLLYFHAVFGKKIGQSVGWYPQIGFTNPVWEILNPLLTSTHFLTPNLGHNFSWQNISKLMSVTL